MLATLSALSLSVQGEALLPFSVLASDLLVLVLDLQKAVMKTACACATGRYTLAQNLHSLCPVCKYWAHLCHIT